LTPLASASSVRSADAMAALAVSSGAGIAVLDFGGAIRRSNIGGKHQPWSIHSGALADWRRHITTAARKATLEHHFG
jgi:hypothetical protein